MPRSKPDWKVLSATFEITAQSTGLFSVAEEICRVLGVESDGSLHLSIITLSREKVFDDRKTLSSGKEVMGVEIKEHVKPRERIRVQASRLDFQ